MMASSQSSMRRGLLPAMVALGAAAAIPAVVFWTDDEVDHRDDDEYRRHKRAKHELWREDAAGFFQSMASRLYSLGQLGSREETQAPTRPFPPGHVDVLKDRLDLARFGDDPPTAILAREFAAEVAEIRAGAESVFGASLPPRFSDCELMRYAIHHGFLRARDEPARRRALHHAALAAADTADWVNRYPFASDAQLSRYSHLLWWTQSNKDARPVLHVNIGRAVHECRGPEAVAFANAVVTQVEIATQRRLGDAPATHDRVDVVVYAHGTSAMSASRAARVLRAVVTTLAHHYPGRLHELTLLDLPKVLLWLVKGAKKLVHRETARKVVMASSGLGSAAVAWPGTDAAAGEAGDGATEDDDDA